MAHWTCGDGTSMPELQNLPIPQDLSFIVIPGSNVTDAAMVACCAPNPINIANGCFEWCEVPEKYEGNDVMSVFSSCLRAEGRDLSVSRITGYHKGGAAGRRASLVGLGVWALVVSTFFVI